MLLRGTESSKADNAIQAYYDVKMASSSKDSSRSHAEMFSSRYEIILGNLCQHLVDISCDLCVLIWLLC